MGFACVCVHVTRPCVDDIFDAPNEIHRYIKETRPIGYYITKMENVFLDLLDGHRWYSTIGGGSS
jgi:hypothetical protein